MGRITPAHEVEFDWSRASGALYRVTANVSAYDPGVLTGPYENAYPPDGGEVEDVKLVRIHAETGEAFPVTGVKFDDLTTKEQLEVEQLAGEQRDEAWADGYDYEPDDLVDGDTQDR